MITLLKVPNSGAGQERRFMRLRGQQARQFVEDVQSGLSDLALMKKYSLSSRGLLVLKGQVFAYLKEQRAHAAKRAIRVNSAEFLKDVRSGLDDDQLMKKYGLTNRQLQMLFRRMIEEKLTTPLELSKRLCITKSQVTEALQEADAAVRELD